MHSDGKEYFRAFDVCQRKRRPSPRDEIPLKPQVSFQAFDKWAIEFVGPINHPGKNTGAHYITTATYYFTRWTEAKTVKDFNKKTTTHFIFENILIIFGFPKTLMSDQGTHFVNNTIQALKMEFNMHHYKITSYHPQENGMIDAFNKILDNALTKVCNANQNDCDVHVPVILWALEIHARK